METTPALELTIRKEDTGSTRVDLMQGERSVSRLWIIPFTLCIGAARVRMDGIGGVGTDDDCRHRGYSRRVLEAAVQHMCAGDGALSMLYGIRDFYPKFGYATAGPDHFVVLTDLEKASPLPAGWQARPLALADLPALRAIYDQTTAQAVGTAVRAPEGRVWTKVAAAAAGRADSECRVVTDAAGQVHGYAWRSTEFWYVQSAERELPDALVMAEVLADGPHAADAVLAMCRGWAREQSAGRPEPVKRVLIAAPPEGPLAAAAMHQSADVLSRFSPCGGSMARVSSVQRLLESLIPELWQRHQQAGLQFDGMLRFDTDLGSAGVVFGEGCGARVAGPLEAGRNALTFRLPQHELARLSLGAFAPEDILARLATQPDGQTQRVLCALFPQRHPHMYLPDRY